MALCTFYNSDLQPNIESQTKDYVLSLISTGASDVQKNEILVMTTHEQAGVFYDIRCIDIDYIETKGNRDFYLYETVNIIIYKLNGT